MGCAGRSIGEEDEPNSDSSGNSSAITSLTTEGSAPQTDDGAPTPEACQKQPQGTRAVATEAEFQQLLVGRWLLCDSISVFGTADEVGLVIHADFSWQKLVRADDGALVASSAWEQSGSWETLDTSDMNGPGVFQLNVHIDGSGTIYTHPVIAVEPDVMRLNNNGVFVADYARL